MKLNAVTTSRKHSHIKLSGEDIIKLVKLRYPEYFRMSTSSKIYMKIDGKEVLIKENPVEIEIVWEHVK